MRKKKEKIKIQVHSSFYSCSLLSAPWCEPLATGEKSNEHSAGCWFSGALMQGQEVARKASGLTHLLEPCISLTQSSSRLSIGFTKSNVLYTKRNLKNRQTHRIVRYVNDLAHGSYLMTVTSCYHPCYIDQGAREPDYTCCPQSDSKVW